MASDSYDVYGESTSGGDIDVTAFTLEYDNMSKVSLNQDSLAEICQNQSMTPDPRCDRSFPGITLTAPIVMMTMGVLGNVLALLVIYSSRQEAQARRTVFFVMLSGLAWTDLVGQLAVGPVAIVVYANKLQWVGGAHMCRYHGFMMTSFGLVTPLIVCCMSVERFLAIRFSYYYARHVTRQKALMTFILCWGATATFSALPFVGFGSYEQQFPGSWCFLNFHRESLVDSIYAALFSCVNIIAILIMIFCNAMVVGTLCMMRRSRQFHSSPSLEPRMSVSQISGHNGTIIRPRRHSDMEAQMIWFLCLITIAFSVCWLPFHSHILGIQFIGGNNQHLDLLFVRMASCNQILDPWLYVIFRKSSFMRLMRRLKLWFFPRQAALEEALRRQNMKKPGRSRSYTVEATTIDRTGYVNQRGGGSSSPARQWCVRNDHDDDLETLKRILEEEKKRPAGSDRPSPVGMQRVVSVESASCLDGYGHNDTTSGDEDGVTSVDLVGPRYNMSLGASPTQSLEFVVSTSSEDGMVAQNNGYCQVVSQNNSNGPTSAKHEKSVCSQVSDNRPMYMKALSSTHKDDVCNRKLMNSKGSDEELKQRLLPSLSYNVPNISSASISPEKDFIGRVPVGLCKPSVSDEKYESTPKSSLSRDDSRASQDYSLSNGHARRNFNGMKMDSKHSKLAPMVSDASNLEFIDDVFDSNVDESTKLCPQHPQSTDPQAQYQS